MHYVVKITQDTWWTQDKHELAKTEITVAVGAAGGITIRNVPNITLDGVSILEGGYDLYALKNINKVNILSRIIKSINYLIWGYV